jgi:hypothetical protein
LKAVCSVFTTASPLHNAVTMPTSSVHHEPDSVPIVLGCKSGKNDATWPSTFAFVEADGST